MFTATGARIGSVRLKLTGAKTVAQTEKHAPYSLYVDRGGRLHGGDLPVRAYTLKPTAYAGRRLSGAVLETLQLSFTVEAVLVPIPLADSAPPRWPTHPALGAVDRSRACDRLKGPTATQEERTMNGNGQNAPFHKRMQSRNLAR